MFRKATRKQAKLKLGIFGPSGSGKTYSSLKIAQGLGGPIAMIDTENGSGELYADLYEYDVCSISPPFTPQKYIDAIKAAEKAGYNVLIVDSLSHAWTGEGGMLDIHDKATQASRSKNSYMAWREVTPLHNKLIDTILQSKSHVIMTARTKVAYEIQDDGKGKKAPVKVGLAPVFREGLDYEATVVFELSIEGHVATASKDRTSLFDGQYFTPSPETGETLKQWLEAGEAPPAPPKADRKQVQRIQILCKDLGIESREEKMQRVNKFLQHTSSRTVESTSELTPDEADKLIEKLNTLVQQKQAEQQQEEDVNA